MLILRMLVSFACFFTLTVSESWHLFSYIACFECYEFYQLIFFVAFIGYLVQDVHGRLFGMNAVLVAVIKNIDNRGVSKSEVNKCTSFDAVE